MSTNAPANPSTTLTCFLHSVRLKRIESKIQHEIYRVDVLDDNLPFKTEMFLETLAAWKNAIPPQSHPRDDHSMNAYVSVVESFHDSEGLLICWRTNRCFITINARGYCFNLNYMRRLLMCGILISAQRRAWVFAKPIDVSMIIFQLHSLHCRYKRFSLPVSAFHDKFLIRFCAP